MDYKLAMIDLAHGMYPSKKFLAVGDSTQKDPETYGEASVIVFPPSSESIAMQILAALGVLMLQVGRVRMVPLAAILTLSDNKLLVYK